MASIECTKEGYNGMFGRFFNVFQEVNIQQGLYQGHTKKNSAQLSTI